MRTIRISSEVWEALAKVGRFGETPDQVLRRVFKVNGTSRAAAFQKRRIATKRMTREAIDGKYTVAFADGASKNWSLPEKSDKTGIRRVRDAAIKFARENGATDGQIAAVMKGLTEAGYHLSK
jgi:hypothetical protein